MDLPTIFSNSPNANPKPPKKCINCSRLRKRLKTSFLEVRRLRKANATLQRKVDGNIRKGINVTKVTVLREENEKFRSEIKRLRKIISKIRNISNMELERVEPMENSNDGK
jgi:hypothetical protein